MGIRHGKVDEIVVKGNREEWLDKCRKALEKGNFTKITVSESLFELKANYKKFATYGEIQVNLMPFDENNTKIVIKPSANYDNIYALFKSPTKKILEQFKNNL